MESSNCMGLMAVVAVSSGVAIMALHVHKRLASDFLKKLQDLEVGTGAAAAAPAAAAAAGSGRRRRDQQGKKKVRFAADVVEPSSNNDEYRRRRSRLPA